MLVPQYRRAGLQIRTLKVLAGVPVLRLPLDAACTGFLDVGFLEQFIRAVPVYPAPPQKSVKQKRRCAFR